MRNRLKPFFILLIAYFTILSSCQDFSERVLVTRVSNNQVDGQGNAASSMGGGTLFYIKGSGFDMITENNKVYIGNDQAKVIGANSAFLMFETISQKVPGKYPLRVSVMNPLTKTEKDFVCWADCNVYYDWWSTSELTQIRPRSAGPTEYVNFQGVPRFTSSPQIDNIKIDMFICDREGLDDVTYVEWDSNSLFQCRVAPEMEAGYYNSTFKVKNMGYSQNLPNFPSLNTLGQLYDFKCYPLVNKVSSNVGSPNGQVIKISGNGFSPQKENVVVTAGDYPCKVLASDLYEITCEVQRQALNQKMFIRGPGVEKRVYNGSNFSSYLDLRTNVFQTNYWNKSLSLPLISYSEQSELDRFPVDGSVEANIAEAWDGYFKPPVTGFYRFYVSGNTQTELYLSNVSNCKNVSNLQKIAYYYGASSYEGPYYNYSQRSDYLLLQKDQYYLLNAFRTASNWGSHFSVAIEVPSNVATPKSISSVQLLDIHFNTAREIQELKIYNYNKLGKFKIVVAARNPDGTDFYRETSPIDYNVNYWDLAAAVSTGGTGLNWRWPSCSRVPLFSNGSVITDKRFFNMTNGYLFQINFTYYRAEVQNRPVQPKIILLDTNLTQQPSFSIIQTQVPSVPLSGNITLAYNGSILDPFPVTSNSIYNWIAKIPGLDRGVFTDRSGDQQDNHQYIFRLSGLTNVPVMTVVNSEAQGGPPGTKPNITITEIVSDSNNSYYSPIPSDMLYLKSEVPQILVQVNNVIGKSVMNLNTTYIVNNNITPIVQNFTVTTTGLTLLLANYDHFSINVSTTTIKFANSLCSISSIALPKLYCTLPKTLNNTFQLEAGYYKPLIHVNNIGYLVYNPVLLDYYVPLQIISVVPNKGSTQGGQTLKISGNGFVFDQSRISSLSVLVGGISAQIISSTNSEIIVKTPPATTSNNGLINILFNGQSNTSNLFQYNDSLVPLVSGINPSTASPSQKTIFSVQGSNFGTDKTKLRLFLVSTDQNRTYELSILNCTSNLIYGVLGGGRSGSYKLSVVLDGIGTSKESLSGASSFKYELKIWTISPNVGSIYGGTNITITGLNLSPVNKQNQVYIGDNNYCVVLESNQSTIICQTKAGPSDSIDSLLKVVVTQRVQEEALCLASNCSFVYVNKTSPIINTNGLPFVLARAGETVTLNGSNLVPTSNNKVIIKFVKGTRIYQSLYFNMELQIEAFEVTSTYLKFKMPALIEGSYTIQVFVGNKGWAWIDPLFTVVTPIEVYGITVDNGNLDNNQNIASRGGLMINITGNGFSNEIVFIDNNVWWCPILQNSTTMITCVSRDIWTENRYTVYVYRDQNNKFTCKNNCSFNISASKSPYVWSSNCSSASLSPNITCFFTGDNLNLSKNPIPYLSDYSQDGIYLRNRIPGKTLSVFKQNLTITFTNIPNNTYRLDLYYEPQGFASISGSAKKVQVGLFNISSVYVASSYLGGKNLTIYGNILPNMYIENLNNISLCGSICKVIDYSSNYVKCAIPKLINPQILDKYQLRDQEADFQTGYDISGDNYWPLQYINDQKLVTYYDSQNSYCNVMFDFRKDYLMEAQEIHYYPTTARSIQDFYGLLFQASYDGVNWDNLFTLDRNMKTGWNIWQGNSPSYRFYKIQSPIDKHPSRCQISEVKFYGIKYYGQANTLEMNCDAKISINGWSMVLPSVVRYSQTTTPIVSLVTPNNGPTSGGTSLTIAGDSFGYAVNNVSVRVDGINCVVKLVQNQKIVCVTGAKNYFSESLLEVFVNGSKAIVQGGNFTYIDRWSDPNTWGGETPPREGDSVYIPPGQNVLLDVTTPILYSVIVEGSLIFEDQDKNFSAYFLVCMNGRVQIGTRSQPFKSKLTITMYGNKQSTQLPEFGNKVWAFHNGILDMNGIPKKITWTLLNVTANIGDTSITLNEPVDWNIGDEIAIASTDFNHNHSESRHIKKISADFKTIILDFPLIYKHFSAIEQYGATSFPMQCEVGLLTRNIVFQGTFDDDAVTHKYGAHLMLHMPGSIGRISYTEFKYVGQGTIIGRYPMHFHRIDDASESYVIGNAVHESWARVVAIHDTHFLTVQKNVGYRVYGHAYFIEDGIETNNLIEDNLGISTIQIWTLINTDVTAATFWITNPNNIVRRNHAAGGDWFGFWYQLENRATGPSSNPDICPDGVPLGEFSNNVAHSYNAFGLRIYEYIPRQFPCQPHSLFVTDDFYSPNPPIPAVFENFTAWKNFENGVMAEHLGSVELRNFLIAESRLSGIQISQANFTREDETRINGAVIVGISTGNKDDDITRYVSAVGLTTPRTDNLLVKSVSFYNFSSLYGMAALKSCSKCWHFRTKITGGKTTKFSNLAFNSVDRKIIWDGLKKEVYIDLDGTLIGQTGSITSYHPHIDGIQECYVPSQQVYDNSIICNSNVQIRPVLFRSAQPDEMFRGLEIRAFKLPNSDFNLTGASDANFSRVVMEKILSGDHYHAWALPFVTGYLYNIHFQDGNLDFTHMNVYPTNYWKPTDKGIVLRFNYSEIEDDFNVTLVKFQGNLLKGSRSSSYLDPQNNNFMSSDFYHNKAKKFFFLGLNGKSNGTIDLVPIKCLTNCNNVGNIIPKESFTRLWSNVSMWNNSRLPQDNEEVYIPYQWTVVLDVNTSNISKIIIDGDLSFDLSKGNLKLTAGIIWVRLGNLSAGSPSSPVQNNIKIQLTGNKFSPMLLIDPYIDSSNKILAVTGALKLYGATPNTIWTKLASPVYSGNIQIFLIDAVDWSIGDEIVIAPTEFNYTEHEKRKIVGFSFDKKTITLDSRVNFFHYGDSNYTYKSSFGQILDMRASVGLLTRKIQITSDAQENWGGNILIYEFTDSTKTIRRGYTELVGVEIINGGQPDTERAALDIKFIKDNGPLSLIKKSSIHDGLGWCVNVYSSVNVTFDNNVFYNCEKFLTRALFSHSFTYTNNLLVAPRARKLNQDSELYDMVAGLDMYLPVNNPQYIITNNLVQGTEGNGFVISGTGCGDDSGFKYNQVNSAQYMGLILAGNNSLCIEATDISIAKTYGGVWSNFDAMGLNLKRMVLAENNIGTQVMFGRENDDNSFIYEDIVFIALARPTCNFCYKNKDSCSGNTAVSLPITVILGKTLPLDKPTPEGLTSICKDAAFDQKLIMDDCLFINYKLDYSSDENTNFASCSNNVVFQQREKEPDAHSNAYLTNTKAINSDFNALANLVEPNPDFMFWRGGCGDFACTGEKNWILTDVDGSFFGQKGQIIPNNLGINIANTSCVSNYRWNGRFCQGIKFGTLEFQNDGGDQRKRIIAPVNITSANMRNTLNEWREWKWEGPEPLDMRLARFSGIVELNSSINLNFEVSVPEELKFKLQKGSKTDVDFVIIKIKYERPNRIEVWNLINSSFVKPYRVDQNIDMNSKINECGANIYNPDQSTIEFVLLNREDCKLKVRTINSVKVSVRMDSTIEDFYSNDGEALFVDKIASFLNIDPSRIRIVNVLKGSVIVNFDIVEDKNLTISTSALDTENVVPQLAPSPLLKASPSDYLNVEQSNIVLPKLYGISYTSTEDTILEEQASNLDSLANKLSVGLLATGEGLFNDVLAIESTVVVGSATKQRNSTSRCYQKHANSTHCDHKNKTEGNNTHIQKNSSSKSNNTQDKKKEPNKNTKTQNNNKNNNSNNKTNNIKNSGNRKLSAGEDNILNNQIFEFNDNIIRFLCGFGLVLVLAFAYALISRKKKVFKSNHEVEIQKEEVINKMTEC